MTNTSKRINRRDFLLNCAAATASISISCLPGKDTGVAGDRKPNIIFILADDLGYGDPGCYGQKEIKTPNIDRLAEEGLRFTDHYAGSTVCAPSRCCLMTGYHTGHAYIRGNSEVKPMGQKPLPEGTVTVADLLKEAGYATALIGKWGLGGPGVQAGHEAAARRCADRAAGIVVREAHPLGGHAVDVRRLDPLLAVTSEVAIAQIVGQDDNDIGRTCCHHQGT